FHLRGGPGHLRLNSGRCRNDIGGEVRGARAEETAPGKCRALGSSPRVTCGEGVAARCFFPALNLTRFCHAAALPAPLPFPLTGDGAGGVRVVLYPTSGTTLPVPPLAPSSFLML